MYACKQCLNKGLEPSIGFRSIGLAATDLDVLMKVSDLHGDHKESVNQFTKCPERTSVENHAVLAKRIYSPGQNYVWFITSQY